MKTNALDIVILGLSITSSWGNGHATTYRGLTRELSRRGHNILFLERDVPWYAGNRDMPNPTFGTTELYTCIEELKDRFENKIRRADLVIVGSYVPEGIAIGQWVTKIAKGGTAFYDIDTPVTLQKLRENENEYITPELIACYNMYLSFTGGPTLNLVENKYGSPMARALYCSADPEIYFPEEAEKKYDLGYIGTFSIDRQPPLEELMLQAARQWKEGRFIVAGPMYPDKIRWGKNVKHITHISPAQHRKFYNEQKFTLNITRAEMINAGYSPSVRLFEAAACGTPIISDYWEGLDTIFKPGDEILISTSAAETVKYLKTIDEQKRESISSKARARVLSEHTSAHRAGELETYYYEMIKLKTKLSGYNYDRNS